MTKIEEALQSIDSGLALAWQRRLAEARQEFMSAAKSDLENLAVWADLGARTWKQGARRRDGCL